MKMTKENYDIIMNEGKKIVDEMFSTESIIEDAEKSYGRKLTDSEKELIKKIFGEH